MVSISRALDVIVIMIMGMKMKIETTEVIDSIP